MSIALLVITDGRRDYIAQTLARFDQRATGAVTHRIIHDDSGDLDYRRWLDRTYGDRYRIVWPASGHRHGFAGAMQSAWNAVRDLAGDAAAVFHLEDDFLLERDTDLNDMARQLAAHPHLAQLSLQRQRWGREGADGFMGDAPGWYTEVSDERWTWVETTRNFTCNPTLYRRTLVDVGWPDGLGSEGTIGKLLMEHGLPWGIDGPDVRFGYAGGLDDGREWVTHIGHTRMGAGY